MTTTAPAPTAHPKTGLPVTPLATFRVGDLVSESIGSDAYPAVVVKATAKSVWVRRVSYLLGNVTAQSHANYLDGTTLVIDPESVERALALGTSVEDGQSGAVKYVQRVSGRPTGRASGDYPSHNEAERMGTATFHRARWARPGGYGALTPGARVRRDPHV